MTPMYKPSNTEDPVSLIKTALWAFALSFGIGTILLQGYLLTEVLFFIVLGVAYIILGFFMNLIIFLNTVINIFLNKHYRLKLFLCALLLLLNIPIAISYFLILVNS
jgi:hypothetical protein